MLEIVGFDLDSTIADTSPRQHMIVRDGTMDWDNYSNHCYMDLPGPALPLAQYLSDREDPFVIVSARGECARKPTMGWLYGHNVKPWHVFLEDDRHKTMALEHGGHGRWKAMKVLEVQEQLNVKIKFFVDDHSTVAEELEKIGIPCILVHSVGKLAEMLG